MTIAIYILYTYWGKRDMRLLAAAANKNDKADKNFAFKNKVPFRSCISKINSTLIQKVEALDIICVSVMYHNIATIIP